MRTTLLSIGFLMVSGLLAQDPKKPNPDPTAPSTKTPTAAQPKVYKAPDGWFYHQAKDTTHSVLLPKENLKIVSSDRTFDQAGFTGKQLIVSCTLKDGRELMLIATALGGPSSKDLKIGEVYTLMHTLDKQAPGVKVSEIKEIPVGIFKGREYMVTRKDEVERNVVVVIRGRIFQLLVTGPDLDSVSDKTADTFGTSLLVHNLKPAAPKAQEKKATEGADKKSTEAGEKKPEAKSSEKKPESKSSDKPSKEGSEKQ